MFQYSSVVQSIIHNQKGLSSQMGFSTSLSPSVIRNPFSPTTTLPHDVSAQRQNDYQHMLHGHMSHEGSMHHRNTLENIQEDDDNKSDEEAGRDANENSPYGGNLYGRTTQSVLGTSMGASMRGLSRREGPAEASQDGLLYSICGQSCTDTTTGELTTVDMCLSTLYLHELHHRQIKRRGLRLEQSHRQLWQHPHQQQSPQQQQQQHTQRSTSMHAEIGHTSSLAASVPAVAEKTPLLGQKKS